MKQTIEATEQELKRVFSDDYLFEIPAYQRPYAWTTEQTSELLDDLTESMGIDEAMDDVPPYFLGSIVLIKEPTSPKAEIVDGQQRLTTLTILLCALRELCDDENSKNDIERFIYERGSKFAGSEDRFRLSLRRRDRDFFRRKVQTAEGFRGFLTEKNIDRSDSQQRLFENSTYLWQILSGYDQSTRDRLMMFLIQRCYLVVVSASDQNSAYRVFSVMNDRGLDLSPTDILKADIIGAMPKECRPEYTDQWEAIEEELGRDDFRDLFAHIRMIYVKSKARGTLNQEFEKGVLASVKGKEFVDSVLTPLAEAYQIVSRSAYESAERADEVNTYLTHLGRLDNYDWVPPAIAFFNMHRDDVDTLCKFVRGLERLAYALFIRRANINERISRYASVLREIEKDDDLFEEPSVFQLTTEEKNQLLFLLDLPVYLQKRVRMPLLLRIDSLLADGGAIYEHRVLSIEHVLPQNPKPDSIWVEWFPDEDERELWTHKLANLVILSRQKNSQAQNYDFERKKKEYFQRKGVATFALTSQVLAEAEWTPQVLESRQRQLLGLLKEEWSLN